MKAHNRDHLLSLQTHPPLGHYHRLDQDWLAGIFQNEFWSHYMMRLLYFEGAPYGYPGLHRIKISPEGGCVLGIGQDGPWDPQHPCIPFKMLVSGKKAPARATTVKRQLLNSFADENSEAFLALRWIHLSPDQRKEDLFSLQNGTLSEMETILQAVLQSQEGIWQDNETLCWRTYYGDFNERSSDLAFAHSPSAPYLLECDAPQRLEQWKQIVSAYFMPTLDTARFRFARNVDEEPNSLSVEANPPTAHERLEAQLLLRDWWQQKLTPLLFETNTPQP